MPPRAVLDGADTARAELLPAGALISPIFPCLSLTSTKTVYSEKCRSWYRLGKDSGRIVGLWPGTSPPHLRTIHPRLTLSHTGSSLHAQRALQHPRWEDYEYEQLDEDENGLYWLGDGQTYNEKTLSGDRACSFSALRTREAHC